MNLPDVEQGLFVCVATSLRVFQVFQEGRKKVLAHVSITGRGHVVVRPLLPVVEVFILFVCFCKVRDFIEVGLDVELRLGSSVVILFLFSFALVETGFGFLIVTNENLACGTGVINYTN